MQWFRKNLTPQLREKNSEKEIELARERAKETGEASLFEYDDSDAVPARDSKGSKRELLSLSKPSEVRIFH